MTAEETPKKEKEVLKKILVVQSMPREWELVENNPEKILEIVTQNLLFKDALLKKFSGKNLVTVKPSGAKNTFIIETFAEADLSKEREIHLYKFTKEQYFEITFEKDASNDKKHTCYLKQLKIAKKNRRIDRYSTKDNPVHANNFMVAKIDLDIKTALGFSTEVIFSEIDKTLKQKYPRSKVVPLFNRDNLSFEEELVLKQQKTIFITNALRMINSKEIETIDLKTLYEEEFILEEKIAQYRKENILSFVYHPIIFKSDTENVIIGYCYNESNAEISKGNIEYFSVIAETIIKRIMDSSTATVEEKQNVLNVSEHGVLIEVTSDYIRDALKTKPSFSMDIIFKMMVPMRFSLIMKHMYCIGQTYYVGADITGSNNDEKGFEKYREIVRAFKT